MEITRLGGPTPTPSDSSPTFYATDRGTYLVQGYRVPVEYRMGVHRLLDNEEVVEIPQYLVDLIRDPSS